MSSRILITMHYMELGGAESALLGLLQALEGKGVEVDLFLHWHHGELLPFIPAWVNLLPEIPAYSVIEQPLTIALRRGQWGVALARVMARIRHRLYIHRRGDIGNRQDSSEFQYVANAVQPFLPRINPAITYHLCISFLQPHNYGLHKVRAQRRLAWIHTDYSRIHVNHSLELPHWSGYDKIASISPDVTRCFIQTFPELEPRIMDMENILSADFIRGRAMLFNATPEMPGKIKLLSIGRFCYPKNFDNIPEIAAQLVNRHGLDIRWYLIGYGDDENLIRQRIAASGMEDHVIILGKKENPYPYIAACDIYVQPSRYEGKSITVREAQILQRPVAITAYATAPSQVRHGHDGIIMPMDNNSCADALAAFINNPNLRQQISSYQSTHNYANTAEVQKILSLLPDGLSPNILASAKNSPS